MTQKSSCCAGGCAKPKPVVPKLEPPVFPKLEAAPPTAGGLANAFAVIAAGLAAPTAEGLPNAFGVGAAEFFKYFFLTPSMRLLRPASSLPLFLAVYLLSVLKCKKKKERKSREQNIWVRGT